MTKIFHATKDQGTWMKLNGKRVVFSEIDTFNRVGYIDGYFEDKNVMADDNESGAYIKFGEGVAKHWVKPEVPSAARTPTTTVVKPYAPMYKEVSQVDVGLFDGINPYTAAFTVNPVKGLNITILVSGDHSAVDEDDVLNGLTQLANHIQGLSKDNKLEL